MNYKLFFFFPRRSQINFTCIFNICSVWNRQKKIAIKFMYVCQWRKGKWVLFGEKVWCHRHFPVSPIEPDTEEGLVSKRRKWHFFVLFFWSFCFSKSGQFKRVFVQETLLRLQSTIMTIKCKMTFSGNEINKLWHTFECTTYFFCTIYLFIYFCHTEWNTRIIKTITNRLINIKI